MSATVLVIVLAFLALQRPDIPYERLEAKYASPESEFVELSDGVRLHFRDQGPSDAPTLILLHGFAASLHTWEPWADRLSERYRVISLDLPGHGLTRAPRGYEPSTMSFVATVNEFVALKGIERFTLAGNSMGGAVAWNYALEYPEDLTALVLVNAAGWRPDRSAEAEREGPPPVIFSLIRAPVIGTAIRNLEMRPLARQGLRSAFIDDSLVDRAMVNRYVELSRAPGHRRILLNITQNGAPPERLGEIATPTLVMHGIQDNLIPVEAGRFYAATIPSAQAVEFDDVGHVPMEEVPDQSAQALMAFLSSVHASRSAAGVAAAR
ncbi:MAG: alpha/beta hydrolase [Hyphomonadaceae bacterium]|nr:alpha/beta hydrolase [Hyphomonadaceae bacterium]